MGTRCGEQGMAAYVSQMVGTSSALTSLVLRQTDIMGLSPTAFQIPVLS